MSTGNWSPWQNLDSIIAAKGEKSKIEPRIGAPKKTS
jgi:hypothetical protein